jgi:anti-anti-sigma regulatory factor
MVDHGISTHRLNDRTWVVALSGDHDLSDVAEVERAIAYVFGAGSMLIVDLTEATLIDSTIMNAILYTQELATRSGNHNVVVMARLESPTRRGLETGLRGHVNVYDDLPAALAAVSQPGCGPDATA